MKDQEIVLVKKAIECLEILRSYPDCVAIRQILVSEKLEKEILTPLKTLVKWSNKDTKKVQELINDLRQQLNGKTWQEKRELVKKILKIGTSIACGITLTSGLSLVALSLSKALGHNKKDKGA